MSQLPWQTKGLWEVAGSRQHLNFAQRLIDVIEYNNWRYISKTHCIKMSYIVPNWIGLIGGTLGTVGISYLVTVWRSVKGNESFPAPLGWVGSLAGGTAIGTVVRSVSNNPGLLRLLPICLLFLPVYVGEKIGEKKIEIENEIISTKK